MRAIKIISLLLVSLLSACAPKMRITPGELPHAQVPPAELKAEAEHYVAAHINESQFAEITKGPEVKRTRAVVDNLTLAAGYPPNTFPVHVLDAGEEVNAAAFNGASIVVYRELLKRVPADDDLATVIGHEVGHILAQHYKDQQEEQNRAQAVSVGSSLLGIAASVAASAAGFGGVSDLAGDVTEASTGAIGYGAFVGSFNRVQEYEADHLGLLIMGRAGYDPSRAVNFWKNAESIFGSSTTKMGSFFGTHPAYSDRIKALEEALPHAQRLYDARQSKGAKGRTK